MGKYVIFWDKTGCKETALGFCGCCPNMAYIILTTSTSYHGDMLGSMDCTPTVRVQPRTAWTKTLLKNFYSCLILTKDIYNSHSFTNMDPATGKTGRSQEYQWNLPGLVSGSFWRRPVDPVVHHCWVVQFGITVSGVWGWHLGQAMNFSWDIRVLTYQRLEKVGHTDQEKYLPGPTTQSTTPWCKRMSSWEP